MDVHVVLCRSVCLGCGEYMEPVEDNSGAMVFKCGHCEHEVELEFTWTEEEENKPN